MLIFSPPICLVHLLTLSFRRRRPPLCFTPRAGICLLRASAAVLLCRLEDSSRWWRRQICLNNRKRPSNTASDKLVSFTRERRQLQFMSKRARCHAEIYATSHAVRRRGMFYSHERVFYAVNAGFISVLCVRDDARELV